MKRFGVFIVLLLVSCGVAPTETKLAGTWQVDLPSPRNIVYAFQEDHIQWRFLALSLASGFQASRTRSRSRSELPEGTLGAAAGGALAYFSPS